MGGSAEGLHSNGVGLLQGTDGSGEHQGHEGWRTPMGTCSHLLCLGGGPLQTHKEDSLAARAGFAGALIVFRL